MFVTDDNFGMSVEHYRQTFKYYAGRLCTCIGENNGQPDPKCGCDLGYWYDEPETIYGIRQDMKMRYTNTPSGVIYNGDCKITIPQYYDNKLQNAYKLITKGDVIVLENKYRRDADILRRNVRDKILAFDVQEVLSVSYKNFKYQKDLDYTVEDRTIIWLGRNEPEDHYSVEFICAQQYKIWDNGAKDRGTDENQLPRLVIGVLRRYVNQEEINTIDTINFERAK